MEQAEEGEERCSVWPQGGPSDAAGSVRVQDPVQDRQLHSTFGWCFTRTADGS